MEFNFWTWLSMRNINCIPADSQFVCSNSRISKWRGGLNYRSAVIALQWDCSRQQFLGLSKNLVSEKGWYKLQHVHFDLSCVATIIILVSISMTQIVLHGKNKNKTWCFYVKTSIGQRKNLKLNKHNQIHVDLFIT